MVAIAKANAQPKRTTKAAAAKKRAATIERKRYIKEATILIEGARARLTSQVDGDRRYDVIIENGKATKCTCPDHQYRHNYCKHMEAVDYRLSLPVLPQGVAKYRKVRGKAELVAVVAPTQKVEETPAIQEVKEETRPTDTRRRTARLTPQPKAVEVTIIERRNTDSSVELNVTDSEGNACTVTLRRNKLHECSVCSRQGCVHIAYCREIENARWKAERTRAVKEARKVVEQPTKAELVVVATTTQYKSEDERRRAEAPLNGKRGFNLLR